jgi:DNA-binding XRE family transcriptional regulator
MTQQQLATYLRSHRRNSGLTQRELASILGYKHEGPVCRHEQATSVPPFFMALAYEAVFRVPASQIFPGFYQTVEQAIEAKLASLEIELQAKSAQDRDAKVTARKLEWLWARRNGIELSTSS